MTTSYKARPGDIWLAYVRFADHPNVGKVRPVVIIDKRTTSIVVAKITSAEPSMQFSYCDLDDWHNEGLVRPSRVQVVPLFQLSDKDLLRHEPLGRLSDRDRIRLNQALSDRRDHCDRDGS